MSQRTLYILLLMLVQPWLPFRHAVRADVVAPFHTQNQNAFIQVYGLPFAEDARLTAPRRLKVSLIANLANHFTSSANEHEHAEWDGETYRFDLALRYGLSSRVEVGLTVPYVGHTGGVLDPFIESWHDIFGLPQSGRKEVDQHILRYRYTRNGASGIEIDRATHGIGDIRLSAGVQLYHDQTAPSRALAVRLSLELPTGDSDRLLGSGSIDVAMWLTARDSATLARYHLSLFGSAGVLYMRPGDVLPEQQRSLVGFGSFGVSWRPLSWLVPKVQVDWHSPFYAQSQIRQLTSGSAQLVIGATLVLPWQLWLDLAVVEDVVVDTAPDIVFHIALRQQIGAR